MLPTREVEEITPQNPTTLVLLCGGGFLFETKCLLEQLKGKAIFTYLTTEFGGEPGSDGVPYGASIRIPTFSTVTDSSVKKRFNAFVATFNATMQVLKQDSIKSVIVVGAVYAIPMFIASWIRGKKSIYIETITRADQLSNTGKLIYDLRLTSLFIVQWPVLQQKHRRSVLGTIL